MNNLATSELPEGFSSVDPNASSQSHAANAEQAKQQAIKEQKQMIMEQACTSEALARLGRIKLVKPEKAEAVENMIVSMAMKGALPGRINEGKLIEILERGSMSKNSSSQEKAQRISIQRKQYGMDSDDDEDDDDDLL